MGEEESGPGSGKSWLSLPFLFWTEGLTGQVFICPESWTQLPVLPESLGPSGWKMYLYVWVEGVGVQEKTATV